MSTPTTPIECQIRIGNRDLPTGSGGTHEHVHPFTGARQGRIPLAGAQEVNLAVEAAVEAAQSWRRLAPEARRDILLRFGALLAEHRDEFAELAAIDGGATVDAGRLIVDLAGAWVKYYAGWCDKLSGELISTLDTRGTFSYTAPEPYGVIGVIITWNGPLVSLAMKVIPALAAGNCVIVKPAELTPFAPDLFARLMRDAGLPDGVLSMLPGTLDSGEALVAHPHVAKISFTGGPDTARAIMASCAQHLKPSVMELGGKSASLVFPDADDLDAVCVRAVYWTIGTLAGQGCALPTRLLVHQDIYEIVVEKVVALARSLIVGDPQEPGVAVGPLINEAAVERVLGMLDRAREAGAGTFALGGGRPQGELASKNFVEPTILTDVDPASEIAQVEIFGPVLVIMKFVDEDDAVRIANSTSYGLAAHLQTSDVRRAHRLGERLTAGGVYVNGAFQIFPHTPFGGLGISGFGKEGGRAGIDEFLRYKTVSID